LAKWLGRLKKDGLMAETLQRTGHKGPPSVLYTLKENFQEKYGKSLERATSIINYLRGLEGIMELASNVALYEAEHNLKKSTMVLKDHERLLAIIFEAYLLQVLVRPALEPPEVERYVITETVEAMRRTFLEKSLLSQARMRPELRSEVTKITVDRRSHLFTELETRSASLVRRADKYKIQLPNLQLWRKE
ncbi:MAG: hypothetical protein V3U49_02520, partial [Nitrososphaerales archaeon]